MKIFTRSARFGRAVLVATAAAATLGTAAACGSSGTDAASSSVAAQHLDVSAFAEAAAKPGTTLIDVRTPGEFAAGHLANAVNIDLQSPDFADRIGQLDKNGTYALYCHTGNRSGQALRQMESAGFGHVFDLSGGIAAWAAQGSPVVTGG